MSSVTAVDTESPEIDTILPVGNEIEVDGIRCRVKRLKAREFMALLRVVVNGFGPQISTVKLRLDKPEELQQDILALLILAVPNAMEEFIAFVVEILEPVDKKQASTLKVKLDNPDLDVLLEVVSILAMQEHDDIRNLVGKAQAMWTQVATIYGMTPMSSVPSPPGADDHSPEPST